MRGQGSVTDAIANSALSLLEIDQLGLDEVDRRILETMIQKFQGGPVGIDTLAAATSEESMPPERPSTARENPFFWK